VPAAISRLDGTAALNCVADTNAVLSAEPFHCTVSPVTKLAPFTVSVNPTPPAAAVVGEMEVMDGAAVVMAKLTEFELAPPGTCTLTDAVPEEVSRLDGTAAFNCVAETNVVLSAEPFHCTISPVTKLAPFTVSVNPTPPATAVVGEMETTDGVAGVMVTLKEFDVAPPGAWTVIKAVPEEVFRLAGGTTALNCVAETNVVLSAEPFHCTISPVTKLAPFTVSVTAVPLATTLTGEIEVIDGAGGGGAETVKLTATVCGEP
jgi:hypothetical protein